MSVLVEPRRRALTPSHPSRRRVLDVAAVGLPTLLGLILCLYDLNTRSLWLDESASITIASQHGAALGSAMAHDGGNMLGFYGLLHVLIGLFGNGSLVARLPSALAAGATIALTCLIALRLWNRRVAAVSGVLAAVSLPLVYWGQDARGYELMIALVCASFLLLVMALERPRPAWGLWLGYVAATTAAIYMGLEAVLVCPAQLLVLLWYRRRARWVLSALLVAGACCIPLAILATGRGSAQLFWIPPPSPYTTRQVLLTLASAGLEPQFYTSSTQALLRLTEVLAILAACVSAVMLWGSRVRAQAWKPVLILGWLLVPPLASWVISELGHSMFEARYVLMSLPAVALLLGWLIVGMGQVGTGRVRAAISAVGPIRRRQLPRRTAPTVSIALRVVAAGLLVALLTLRALQLAPSYGVSTEPWRAATRHVLASLRPRDCIAFYPQDARMPFRYYLPGGAQPPREVLPSLPWTNPRPFVEVYSTLSTTQLRRVSRRCNRVWLLSGHQGHNDGTVIGARHAKRYQDLVAGFGRVYLSSRSVTYGAAHILTLQLFSGPTGRSGLGALF